MKFSKHALTVLTQQYRSVLLKCALINAGLLLAAAPAMAAELTGGTLVVNPVDANTYTIQTGSSIQGNIVEKTLTGANGTAMIFNESDGGGAMYTHEDGAKSFVGVHDGSGNNVDAQIYSINGDKAAILDVTENGMYYTTTTEGIKPAADRMKAENEIATKGNIADAIDGLKTDAANLLAEKEDNVSKQLGYNVARNPLNTEVEDSLIKKLNSDLVDELGANVSIVDAINQTYTDSAKRVVTNNGDGTAKVTDGTTTINLYTKEAADTVFTEKQKWVDDTLGIESANADAVKTEYASTNYLADVTTLTGADIALDTQVKTNADEIAKRVVTNNGDGTAKVTDGTTTINLYTKEAADTVFTEKQKWVDDTLGIESANADAVKTEYASTNYLADVTTLTGADIALDTQIKTNADEILKLTTDITTGELNVATANVGGNATIGGKLSAADGKFFVGSTGYVKAADGKIILGTNGDIHAADGQIVLGSNGDIHAASEKFIVGSQGNVKAADGQFVVDAEGNLVAQNATLKNTTVDGTLDVAGKATFADDVEVQGKETVAGTFSAAENKFFVGSTGYVKAADGKIILGTNGDIHAADGQIVLGSNGDIHAASEKFIVGSQGNVKAADGQFVVDAAGNIAGKSLTFNGTDLVNAIDTGATAVTAVTDSATTIATTATVIKSAENGIYTNTVGETSNVNGGNASTLGAAITDLDRTIGNMDFSASRYVADDRTVGDAIRSLDTNLSRVDNEVRDMRKDMDRGFASMAALSALVPNARATGNTQLSAGTGMYSGHVGFALGGFHWFTDNLVANVGIAYGDGSASDMIYRAGVTYSW